jgi:two-component system, OmpR family, KDP operon response regulator KdpE
MPNNPLKVVVADDDPAMRRSLCAALRAAGYAVEEARDGEQAVRMFRERQTDLVLLDINMPGIGGIEACRRIRAAVPSAGIIMITVREAEEDIIQALGAGADDYLTKPFRIRELMARLGAVMRRSRGPAAPETPILRAGKLELDVARRSLRKSGDEVHLSPIEFDLLLYMMQHGEVPLEHSKLLRTIWGPEYGQEFEYLRTYVRLIRKKIEDNPARPEYILTEPWLGYRFHDPATPLQALVPTSETPE